MKVNDKCHLTSDWISAEAKKAYVQVIGFQTNIEQYARVIWLGRKAKEFETQFGILFPVKELRKA